MLSCGPSVFLLVHSVLAAESFSSPYLRNAGVGYGSNLVWTVGSTKTVEWDTGVTSYNVTLWQQNLSQAAAKEAIDPIFSTFSQLASATYADESIVRSNGAGHNTEQWPVKTMDLNLDDSNVFFFWLVPSGKTAVGGVGFTSPPFNISRASVSSSSASASASTTTGPNSTGSTSISGQPSSIATQLPASVGENASSVLKLGLGLGLGIGIPLMLLVGILLGFQASRRKKEVPPPLYAAEYVTEKADPVPPQELDPTPYQHPQPPFEVDGQDRSGHT